MKVKNVIIKHKTARKQVPLVLKCTKTATTFGDKSNTPTLKFLFFLKQTKQKQRQKKHGQKCTWARLIQ